MKINLSKEHIEKGCKLEKGYDYFDGQIWSRLHKGFVTESDDPLYRDFLQLVIEAIEETEGIIISIWKIETGYQFNIVNGVGSIELEKTLIFHSRVEAKEKAIAYVFNNMEVE